MISRRLCALLATLATACAAAPLVSNAAFDTADGWTLPAAGWKIVDDDGHSGSFSLQYASKGNGAPAPVTRQVAVQPNTDYVLTAWVKSDGALHPVLVVEGLGQQITRTEPGVWQPVAFRFNSRDKAQLMLRLFADELHTRNNAAAAGSSGIDDVQLYLAAEAPATVGAQAPAPPGRNLALERPYTYTPDTNYGLCKDPGDKTQLTDGEYSVGYFWAQPTTVGWSRGGPYQIQIDLGEVQPISGLSLNTAAGTAGVAWPFAIYLAVSDDGANWYRLGDLIAMSAEHSQPPLEGYATHRYWTGNLNTFGRYVALAVAGTGYFFTDEVEVYEGAQSLLAKPRPEPTVTDIKATLRQELLQIAVRNQVVREIAGIKEQVTAAKLPAAEAAPLLTELAAATEAAKVMEVDGEARLIVPMSDAQRQAFAVQAKLWQAAGRPAFTFWQQPRYERLAVEAPPPTDPPAPTLAVRLMQNEVRADSFVISNASGESRTVTLRADGLPGAPQPEWLDPREVTWTETATSGIVGSALSPATRGANGWEVEVPAGMSREIWLLVDSASLPAGTHVGTLAVTGLNAPVTLPFTVQVSPLRMPDQLSLSLGGWDYTDGTHRGITDDNRDETVAFLREYHVDSPWATSGVMPFGTHDADGKMTAPPSTERMDAWLARWPEARYYGIFNAVGSPVPETPAGQRRVQEWITFWVGHFREKGIEPQRVLLHLFDESHAEETDLLLLSWIQAIKAVEPEVQVYNDPTWRDPRQAVKETLAGSDWLCPNRQMWIANPEAFREVYLGLQDTGATLTFYSCSGPVRSLDPYSYHRLQAWDCFRYGMKAGYFWAFGDNGGGSAWNEAAASGVVYSPQYLDDAGNTTAKHMEAIREGLYDHEYLVMLRDAVDAAEKAGRRDAKVQQAKALLEQGPERVLGADEALDMGWGTPKDRSLADTVRLEALDLLEALRG